VSELNGVLLALYRSESSCDSWARELSAALQPAFSRGLGCAVWYAEWPAGQVQMGSFACAGVPSDLRSKLEQMALTQRCSALRESTAPGAGEVTRVARLVGPSTPPDETPRSVLSIHACHPDGRGVGILIPRRGGIPPDERPSRRLLALAEHLSASLRLQREWKSARAADFAAMHELEQNVNAEMTYQAWCSLVAGRYRVVDQFDTRGRRYVVAIAVQDAHDPRGLTARECRILTLRAEGHPLKYIADELALSVSTIAITLSRAQRMLGLRYANELRADVRAPGDSARRNV
jgi:DNA-binding CsgD family transcriptional regulator